MPAQFYNISRQEMEGFLFPQGFRLISLENTYELVYGKIVRIGNSRFSLRIYTGIDADSGQSRARGSDAIRIQLYYRMPDDEQPFGVGKNQICLRVKSWRKNIQKTIDKLVTLPPKKCPKCGHPMVVRKSSRTKNEFWGCCTYPKTGCNIIINIEG